MTESWSLPDVLAAQTQHAPHRAFFSMIGEPVLSVGEVELRSRRVANGLRELGVGFGDRVLVMLPNGLEFIEAWFAINRLGAVLVTVNTAYRGSFLEHLASNSGAKVMIVDAAFLPVVAASEAALPELEVLVVAHASSPVVGEARPPRLRSVSFGSLRSAPERGIDVRVSARDLSAIVYTSGTTGKSKGVMIPHAQMYLNPLVYLEQLGIGRDDVFYSALPLFHTNALALQVYGALIAGCRVHLAPQFSASRWLSDVRATGATVTNLLGVMTEFVFRQPPTPHDADNALRIASAVPMPPALAREFEQRFGVQLVELYGSTEANCPLYQPRDEPRRDGSCGKVVARWFECRIVDTETDAEVPDGEVGELLVRPLAPGGFMAGYNAMPDETVKAWRDLWFHTGDAMRRDADGYHYFVDRMKDWIRRRAENISSYEVEQVVLLHESVEEVAAIGIRSPYEENEQEVKVCVVCKPGARDAAALHAFCAARMPAFAVPRFIEFCASLPKTPTLKVRKQELRERGVTPETWVAPDAAGRGRAPAGSNPPAPGAAPLPGSPT